MKKKKGLMRMNRRTFVWVILGICAAALLTEGILLTCTFLKKKDKGSKKEKPVQETVVSGSPTPSAAPETVWRIAHYTEDNTLVVVRDSFYEYDGQGRLIREKRGYPSSNIYFECVYEKSGIRLIRWDLEENEEKTDDNYFEMEFWPYPLQPYDNEFYFYKAADDPPIEIVYDEKGYWKEVKLREGEGARFQYDEAGRITFFEKSTVYGEIPEEQEPVYMIRTMNLTYHDEDGHSITAIQTISNPGRRLEYEMAFEDGKIIRDSVYLNGTKLADTEWKYMAGGTRIHKTQYIDNDTIDETECWEIPLQLPNTTLPGSFETVSIDLICGDEVFTADENGRIDGKISNSGSDADSKVKMVEYDQDGRITRFFNNKNNREIRYTYDENGVLSLIESFYWGESTMTAKMEAVSMTIDVSDSEAKR